MSLYQDKYRVESTRLRNWDYASDGCYFITICTKNRECSFGMIIDDKMILSEIGKIANKYWQEIPNHFPFVRLDNYIVMPNHIHGIIIIDNSNNPIEGAQDPAVETPNLGVSTVKTNIITQNKYWKPGNLGVIINQYKRKCTIESQKINPFFQWQPRFYDHVTRNKQDLARIQKYIQNNPRKWQEDGFYKLNNAIFNYAVKTHGRVGRGA